MAVALDPLGRVWVADGQLSVLRVFDAHGKLVRSIGRKGRGPRDFASISGLTFAPDGRLWVLDGGNARFAVYDTAGNLVRTAPRNSSMTSTPWPGRFDAAGRLYDVSGTLARDGSILTSIVRLDSALQPSDTFHIPPFRDEVFQVTRGDKRNRVTEQIIVPFTGMQTWKIDPSGFVWIANSAHYRIERHGFDGGVQGVVERKSERVPVSRSERERMLEGYQSFIDKGGKFDESRIPKVKPALIHFMFDDAGRMWVVPVTNSRRGRVLDVFDAGGKYLGRVDFPMPAMSSVQTIRGDRMVVVQRDSLNVESVILLRIVKPAG